MRIHGPSRPSSHNNIQMHISRNRPKWGMLCWFTIALHDNENRVRDKAMNLLSNKQISNNTTRGTTPGLINPALGEAGGRVSLKLSKMGAGFRRRGRRAPGKGHGGGNNQERYRDRIARRSKRPRIQTSTKHHQPPIPEDDDSEQEYARQDTAQAPVADMGYGNLGYRVSSKDILQQARLTGSEYGHPDRASLALEYAFGTSQGFHDNGIHSDPLDYFSWYEVPNDLRSKETVIQGPAPPGISTGNKRKLNEAFGSLEDIEQWRSQKIARPGGKHTLNESRATGPPHPIATRSSPAAKALSRSRESQDSMRGCKRLFVDESEEDERPRKVARVEQHRVARRNKHSLARPSGTTFSRHHGETRSKSGRYIEPRNIDDATPSPSIRRSMRLRATSSNTVSHKRDPRLDISYCMTNISPNQHNVFGSFSTKSVIRASDQKQISTHESRRRCSGSSAFQWGLAQSEVHLPPDLYLALSQQGDLPAQLPTGDIGSHDSSDHHLFLEHMIASGAGRSSRITTPETLDSVREPKEPSTSDTTQSYKQQVTTTTRPGHPRVDGAESGRTMHHYEPSLSDQELNFEAYLNEPETDSGESTDSGSNQPGLTINDSSILFPTPLIPENLASRPAESNIDETNHIGRHGHSQNKEPGFDPFNPLPCNNGSTENIDPSVLDQEEMSFLGLNTSDPLTSTATFIEWDNFDLEF
ncbi:MAG: hypothetical protein LQ338_005078 [Usnochroma carphineum]|nr:MAG: hypothetical protein LQ338_005078 [Usnochroma carphineum]